MAKEYVVVGEDNLTSWNHKTESGERFTSYPTACKRAAALAKCEPGVVFTIFEANAAIVAPVGPVEIKRLS